jgi:hypothetical protein
VISFIQGINHEFPPYDSFRIKSNNVPNTITSSASPMNFPYKITSDESNNAPNTITSPVSMLHTRTVPSCDPEYTCHNHVLCLGFRVSHTLDNKSHKAPFNASAVSRPAFLGRRVHLPHHLLFSYVSGHGPPLKKRYEACGARLTAGPSDDCRCGTTEMRII